MKALLLLLIAVFAGCAYDTGSGISYDDSMYVSSSSYDLWSWTTVSSSSVTTHSSVFPTDLSYVAINKDPNGVNLVMKNNTAYEMRVNVNYSITCSINGKAATTNIKTAYFSFKMYEQKEYQHMDGFWHGGMDTITCTGVITSITPASTDRSNLYPLLPAYQRPPKRIQAIRP